MAGFEVVVRPVIFADIRPARVQSVPSQEASTSDTSGMAVITGSSGRSIDLPYSWSVSTSQSKGVETQRRVDQARVYQTEDDGTINTDNFVDLEVANKVWLRGGNQQSGRVNVGADLGALTAAMLAGAAPRAAPTSSSSGYAPEVKITYLTRVQEGDNIEIRNRNIIKKNPDAPK